MSEEVITTRKELGQRIRDARDAQGLKAKDLASRAGISPSFLSEVEKGDTAISGEKLLSIARQLRMSLSELVEGTSSTKPVSSETEVRIPSALSEAAEKLNLTFTTTVRLLHGKQSLRAKRSTNAANEWTAADWIEFYNSVKNFMMDREA